MTNPHLVGKDEFTVAADPPGILQACVDPAFAHRQAPEHEAFGDEEDGPARDVGVEAPLEPRALEHQRLLGQPEEPRARRQVEPRGDAGGRAVAAVYLLRRRRGRLDLGVLAERQAEAVGVAAGDAAACIDDRRLARARRAGKAPAQASGLEDALRLGALPDAGEGRARLGLRALGPARIERAVARHD